MAALPGMRVVLKGMSAVEDLAEARRIVQQIAQDAPENESARVAAYLITRAAEGLEATIELS